MKKIILLVLMLSFTQLGLAKDGSSGCGPGWYIMKDNSLLSSALRATTNGILGITVTLGMTFGTSNCTKHSIVKREKENLKFATENYFEIAADVTKGEGQFITAYGELMGCRGESLSNLKGKMKKNFEQLYKENSIDPRNLVQKTYEVILRDSQLTRFCFSA